MRTSSADFRRKGLTMAVVRMNELLNALVNEKGEPFVVGAVHDVIQRRAAELKVPNKVDRYLGEHKARGLTRDSVSFKTGAIKSRTKLILALRAMQITVEDLFQFDPRRPPWDLVGDNETVAVVLGGKFVEIPGSSSMQHQSVGARDAEAIPLIEKIVSQHLQVEAKVRLFPVSPNMTPLDAENLLQKLSEHPEIGVIVVLGSELVNPLAAPIARRILRSPSQDLPYRFRWSFDPPISEPHLSETTPCLPDQEGIHFRRPPGFFLRRVRDENILKASHQGTFGPFADCGLLAITPAEEKLMILCAGHGGCGTLATVLALSEINYIERRLLEAFEDGVPNELEGVFCEPVWVKRTKETEEPIDDLTFDRTFGVGWGFHWDEEV